MDELFEGPDGVWRTPLGAMKHLEENPNLYLPPPPAYEPIYEPIYDPMDWDPQPFVRGLVFNVSA